jgi:hypothetical protein
MIFVLEPQAPLNDKQEQILRSIYECTPRKLNSQSGIKYTVQFRVRKATKDTIRDLQLLLSELGEPVKVKKFL